MTKFIRKPTDQKKESGFILIATIIIATLLGFLGVTASYLFTSGSTTTKDYLLSARAFFAAEGGLEWGIRQYLLSSTYSGNPPPPNLTLGGQSYPLTTSVFTTDFSGNTLPPNQLRIRSSCTYQSVQRVVDQIVQRQSVFSQSTYTSYVPYEITSQGNIIVGGTTYTSCPGTGCLSYLRTNQPMAPITVAGGSDTNFSGSPSALSGIKNYNNLILANNTSLSISGTVTINCKTLTIGDTCSINAGSGNPDNLLIVVQGNVTIGKNFTLRGALYAPNGSITSGNSLILNGAMAGNIISIGTPSTITPDNGAGSNAPNGYTNTAIIGRIPNSWQEVF